MAFTNRWRYIVFLLALLVIALPSSAVAQEDANQPPKYPVETADFELTVESADGTPIEGARVMAYAARCVEDPGSHYGWPAFNVGKAVELTTDERGVVKLKYPIRFGVPPDWLTTSEISMSVRHPLYVGDRMDVDPRIGSTSLSLDAGCQLTFSAQHESEQPIARFGVMIAGPGGQAQWIAKDGIRTSRAIPDGRWQTMLVSPSEDGLHLFSGVLPVRLADKQDVSVSNVMLRPGTRFYGKLDDSVPRPVENGEVVVWCLPKPAGRVYGVDDPSLSWSDAMPIAADGTFEFKSLPRSGKIQVIAQCDGWLIADDPNDELEAGRSTRGIYFDVESLVDEAGSSRPATLAMEPTGTVEVTVLGPDSKPLPGVRVSTWPNQVWQLSGSQVLGSAYRSIDALLQQIDGNEGQQPERNLPERYSQMTNADGKVTLSGIPINRSESMDFAHDEYIFDDQNKGDADVPVRADRTLRYVCETPEVKRIDVTLKPRPK